MWKVLYKFCDVHKQVLVSGNTMVQFTYVSLTLCKLFPTLKRNPEFISFCRNVHIDHMSISSRGIFNWVKIEGEKGF